jgi:outer membrane lipoprotein SlyB
LQGPVYGANEQRQVARSLAYGQVIEVKPVILQGKQQNINGVGTGSIAGGALGGIIGGALGSKIGKGTGNTVATAAGVVVGGVIGAQAGDQAGNRLAQRQGLEIVVRLDNGQTIASIQEANQFETFRIGQTVRATEHRGGWHISVP